MKSTDVNDINILGCFTLSWILPISVWQKVQNPVTTEKHYLPEDQLVPRLHLTVLTTRNDI